MIWVLFLLIVTISLLACGTLRAERRVRADVARERDRARAAEAEAVRLLRLGAHDVRSECMSLLGCADGLTAGAPDPALHAHAVAAAAGRILSVADDFEDFFVPDAATRVLDDEELDLGPLLREAVTHVAASLGPTRRAWRLDPSAARVRIRADGRALTQVLIRVLSNAARACGPEDPIEISFAPLPDGKSYALLIEDEGSSPAIAGGAIPRPGSERRGLGLGLTLSRRLMEAHGGALTLEGAARVGTRVTLRLPADRVTLAPSPAPSWVSGQLPR